MSAYAKRRQKYTHLTEDRHQQALYRLAAVAQYLYDTMNGDQESDRVEPDPLPLMSMEHVREAQRLIDLAIKNGQRTRRTCLGGDLELIERKPEPLPPKYRLEAGRVLVTFIPGRSRFGARRHQMGGFDAGLGCGVLIGRVRNRGVGKWGIGRRAR